MARGLTTAEQCFLTFMLKRSRCGDGYLDSLAGITVEEADDGGMKGLVFASANEARVLGEDIAQIWFNDIDGVEVMATLTIDNAGDLYELEVWKVDFSPLLMLPANPVVIAR